MAKYSISLRIQLMLQYLHDFPFATKEQLIDFLTDKDLPVASRTIERDFEKIRADFGIEITYDYSKKGYFIDEEKSVKVDSFFRFLEIVQVADILTKSLENSNEILEHVSFDDSRDFKGIHLIKNLLLAILQQRQADFVHENFENETTKSYSITPLLLKEYLNRWYVIGVTANDEVRTFGLDRISNLKMDKPAQKQREHYKQQLEKFNHTVGLTYGDGKPEKVVLLVDELHVKYMRSLPLHHSQIIHPKDTNNQHKVEFLVYPNYEFKTQILKIGAEVEVLEPLYLREEIKGILEDCLRKYK